MTVRCKQLTSTPPGVAPRRAAVQLLHEVLASRQPLDQRLPHNLRGLSGRDRSLAHALTAAVLRNLGGLDRLIDSVCQRQLASDARARQVLRVALAGRLVLDAPAHAIVATALPLVQGGQRRLVHGVLSNLLRQNPALPAPALPADWAARWRKSWGEAEVLAATRQFAAIPPTDLTLRDASETAELAQQLRAESLLPRHLRLAGSQNIRDLPGYAQGKWWVQDLAASLPARLFGDIRGLRVLDLCAAPGGKTMQLAAADAHVTALDVSAARLERLRENLHRTNLAADIIRADALQWQPAQPFDCILLDAPCSASGTYRRHPDLLHIKAELDLAPLVRMQTELLRRSADWLKPGGLLVYAVCSLEPAEGEMIPVPEKLIADPIDAAIFPASVPVDGHCIRILPSTFANAGGADGFYMARYRRARPSLD